MDTVHDDLHILKKKILLNSSQQENCFRQKLYRKSKHAFNVPLIFSWCLWDVEKYGTAKQATEDNVIQSRKEVIFVLDNCSCW